MLREPDSKFQRNWDNLICGKMRYETLENCTSETSKAWVLSNNSKEAGAWLNALPSTSLKTLLYHQSFETKSPKYFQHLPIPNLSTVYPNKKCYFFFFRMLLGACAKWVIWFISLIYVDSGPISVEILRMRFQSTNKIFEENFRFYLLPTRR